MKNKDILISKLPDVRPLNHRETKMNLRKGMFTRKHSSDLLPDAREQLLFSDEATNIVTQSSGLDSDDIRPLYAKKLGFDL
jgi:hypothetical protein